MRMSVLVLVKGPSCLGKGEETVVVWGCFVFGVGEVGWLSSERKLVLVLVLVLSRARRTGF